MRSRGVFTVATVCLLAMGCTSLCGKGGGGAAPGGGAGAGAAGPAVPLVLKDCFTDSTGAAVVPTSSFTGVYGPEGLPVTTTGTLTYANGDIVTFVHGGTVTADDPVTGRSYTGTLTLKPGTNPPEYDVNFTLTQGGFTITVTGTITIGRPCTGSGNWSVKRGVNQWAQGTWKVP